MDNLISNILISLSKNNNTKIFIISIFIIDIIGISIYFGIKYSNIAKFTNINPTIQNYLVVKKPINIPYFAKDIYTMPGQARLAHNVNTKNYNNSYLPYESAIPAIDVLRANTNINY